MRLQTDLEFQQNEIKKLNTKYTIEMFSSHVHGGKHTLPSRKLENSKNFFF